MPSKQKPSKKNVVEEKVKVEQLDEQLKSNSRGKKQHSLAPADPTTRPVVYPEVKKFHCVGAKALTVSKAKDMLGWLSEKDHLASILAENPDLENTDPYKFGDDYFFKDEYGEKVRLIHNANNRPFNDNWARGLAQDILHSGPAVPEGERRWQYNGEAIIIGKTKLVMSGQHRLVGLVLAGQLWAGPQNKHWSKYWPTEPTLDTDVTFGVSELPCVMRTLDNTKPRTTSDVLYTSPVFQDIKLSDKELACRMAEKAIRYLWYRTGTFLDAFSHRRTNAESLDWVDRHPKLIEAVRHILVENVKRKTEPDKNGKTVFLKSAIGEYIDPGTASALLYLMAACNTKGEDYWAPPKGNGSPPSESLLDLSYFEKALDFWTLVAKRAPEFKELDMAFKALGGPEGKSHPTLDEKVAILIKAWNKYALGSKVTKAAVDLEKHYTVSPHTGNKILTKHPVLGGIDRGNPWEQVRAKKEEDDKETEKEESVLEEEEVSDQDEAELNEEDEIVEEMAEELDSEEVEELEEVLVDVPSEDKPEVLEKAKNREFKKRLNKVRSKKGQELIEIEVNEELNEEESE